MNEVQRLIDYDGYSLEDATDRLERFRTSRNLTLHGLIDHLKDALGIEDSDDEK
jgi:hypothetical protein